MCPFDDDHYMVSGFKIIDGKQYYFNNVMVTSWSIVYNHLYEFNANGVFAGQNTTQNGWVQKDGVWFYFRDGALLSGIVNIDGKVYGFNPSMVRNGILYHNDDGGYYFFGSDGILAAKEGWRTDNEGYRYYTDATGRALTGIRKIDGKTCYFDYMGRLMP